ncbi:MAG: hypothetical protein PVI87_09505 [Gammaproteobacteria bacterium]
MKANVSRLVLPVAAAGMLVSGCAAVPPGEETVTRHEIDREYVAVVEQSARGMPVDIIWVNPPRKAVEKPAKVKFKVDLPQD